MPSPEQLDILWNLSDEVLYPQAVDFIHHLIDEEDCDPLPASQVAGLLNIANASSYTELNLFIRHQCERDWQGSKKDIKTFYTRLDEFFTTFKKTSVREVFHLNASASSTKKLNEEIDELMALVTREFIQHLIAENMVVLTEKANQRARKW